MVDASRRKWLLPGAVFVLALAVWVLAQARGGGVHVEQAATPPSLATSQAVGAISGGESATQAGDPGTDSIAELIEAQAGQLADVLAHLRGACAAAQAGGASRVAGDAAARCVEDAEGAMHTADLIRGSISSPAGAGMPADVRRRWDQTLAEATATVRGALAPLWDEIGRVLASGTTAPAETRALGHLRDRIGRILSEVGRE